MMWFCFPFRVLALPIITRTTNIPGFRDALGFFPGIGADKKDGLLPDKRTGKREQKTGLLFFGGEVNRWETCRVQHPGHNLAQRNDHARNHAVKNSNEQNGHQWWHGTPGARALVEESAYFRGQGNPKWGEEPLIHSFPKVFPGFLFWTWRRLSWHKDLLPGYPVSIGCFHIPNKISVCCLPGIQRPSRKQSLQGWHYLPRWSD